MEFHYSNTLRLQVAGVHHTGKGLPWFARALVRTAALAVTRNWGSSSVAEASLGFAISGHFEGPIKLELDMMPSHASAYPLIRHLRFHDLPKVVRQEIKKKKKRENNACFK